MPPRMVFENKQRPDGLVFPACKECNELTRDNDAIISWFSRLYYGGFQESVSPEFERLSRAMARYPELTREFKFKERLRYIRNAQGLIVPTDMVTVNVGPITRAVLEQFALKFALAMHWHVSGEIVPADVPIWVMGTTNYHQMTNRHVRRMLATFQAKEVMRQGIMTSAGQFAYQSIYVADTGESIHYGGFRESFAVCCQVRPAMLSVLPPSSIRFRRDLRRPFPYLDPIAQLEG
ncbi:hypothetical protein MKK52_05490 [Methylobacterium sp. J-067]|nr:hypothetical protein [Methylobacterium sp. J-067]